MLECNDEDNVICSLYSDQFIMLSTEKEEMNKYNIIF